MSKERKVKANQEKIKFKRVRSKTKIGIIISIAVLIAVSISIFLFVDSDSNSVIQRILISGGVTGFIGLFVQLTYTFIKEIAFEKENNRRVAMIIVDVSFSRALASGVEKAFSTRTNYRLDIIRIEPEDPENPEEQDRKIIEEINECLKLGYNGIIVRTMRPIDEKMEKCLTRAIEETFLVLMDYDFSDAKREEILRSGTRVYGFIDAKWKGERGGCELISKLITKKLKDKKYICLCIDLHRENIPNAGEYMPAKRNELIMSSGVRDIANQYIPVTYHEGEDVNNEIVKELKKAKEEYKFTNDNNLVVICGYDTIARGLMEYAKMNDDLFYPNQEVVYVGYDGLRDHDGKRCILDFLGSKFVTIDIKADEQGEKVAKCLEVFLERRTVRPGQNYYSMDKPKLIHNLCDNFENYKYKYECKKTGKPCDPKNCAG